MAFHLDDQRPAEERADDDEYREHQDVLHRGLQSHGPDDVGSHEQLEPQQQRLSQLGLVALVRIRDSQPRA